ncbi:hypothetical protein KIW84_060880 [Lathyrus oleraceus]|uniref:Uncharacterized protein n=1 Tax=Pisum sativum TaxID=3888 RepID=A0A9D5A4F2_PEA|nr:hypothetical protein KIW84_060880 [Pisum sativum]
MSFGRKILAVFSSRLQQALQHELIILELLFCAFPYQQCNNIKAFKVLYRKFSTINVHVAGHVWQLKQIQPTCNDNAIPIDEDTKEPSLSVNKFEPVCNEEEREFAKSKEQSWFSGYDKCNT